MNKIICLVLFVVASTIGMAESNKQLGDRSQVRRRQTSGVSAKLTVSRINPSKAFVKSGEKGLFLKRLPTAQRAELFFRNRGVTSDKAIIAILVNAWHECHWDYTLVSGNCIGFFQLNRAGGMGRGHSFSKLRQLEYNMTIMADSLSF